MKDLIKETVGKIKKQGITPQARWVYLAKRYGIWSLFFVAIFLGAASFSIAFDTLRQLDWDLYRFMHRSVLVYSLSLLPYLWLVFIGTFLALSFFDLRKTETGYKYSWPKMTMGSVAGVLMVGFVFSLTGLGGKMNAILVKDLPFYNQHMVMTKEKQWMQPENGFLAGTLTAVSNSELAIEDLNGKTWKVVLDEKTLIRPVVAVRQGEMIKIIGSQRDIMTFHAIEIRPWIGPGMMNRWGTGRMNGEGNGPRGMMR